ncbi:hypothetical protein PVAND_017175 [Polypedilum vanderplanki]|uniref:NACHT domain-containing protein n=1 Tax=Polypedilum vanderplanki TaxID=319348 RepID=A0A9J6BHJ8_POLVA|nr:hypothetical protein PVAND_017175 [Polypedilum vanderplanki]
MDSACTSQNILPSNNPKKQKFYKNCKKIIKKVKSIKSNSEIKQLQIVNISTIKLASKIISKVKFTKNLFRKFPSLNVLRIKIENEIKNISIIRKQLYKTREKFLLTFESTLKNQIIFFWKNSQNEEFLSLNLLDNNLALSVKLLAIDFIIEKLGQKDGTVSFCSNEKFDLSTLIGNDNENLLFEAVLKNDLQLVKDILKLSIDVNSKIYLKQNNELVPFLAIDYAYGKSNYEIVYELLNANSMFPKKFNQIEASKKSEKLRYFIENADRMTKAIKNNNIEEIILILKANLHLRHFFNVYNISAMRFAVRKENLEIYRIFSESGVSFGPDESFNENCDQEFIKRLCDYNSSAAQPLPEIHIMILLSKSVVTQNDKNLIQRLTQIRETFEILNSIPEIKPTFKLLALDKKTKFFFDFTQNSIVYMNPQVRGITRASFDHTKHHIQIGAKQLLNDDTKCEVFGSLSHECHHSVFNKVFMNDRLPYAKNDEENKEKFDKIIEEYEKLKNFEPIVEDVFKYYDKDAWGRELAVRVPHMLAAYINDQKRLETLKLKCKNLFDFHYKNILPQFEAAVRIFDKLSDDEREISFDELTNPLKLAIRASWVEFQGMKVQLKEFVNEEILMLLNSSQIRQILNRQIIKICKNLNSFEDLFFMERNFIDNEFDIEKIWRWDWNNKRLILTEDVKEASKNFNSILIEVCQSKIFLLSDCAGAGKTTVMKNLKAKIKENFPQNWVEYVDLKRHLKVYENYQKSDLNEVEKIINILIEILSINENFEIEIFKHIFLSGRVVLLFDGVDEIAPNYKDFFFNLIKNIKYLTENHQWIATRPQHKEELRKISNEKFYELLPFDFNETQEYIINYFKTKSLTGDIKVVIDAIYKYKFNENPLLLKMVADLHINGKLLNNYTNKSEIFRDFIEMKRKILNEEKGEIANFERDKSSKMTIWEIYQIYALKLIFGNNFGDVFCYKIHDDFQKFVKFDEFQLFKKWKREKTNWSPEAISRYGFLFVDNWNSTEEFPDFTHRAFAEFFIEEFIFDNVKEAIEDGEELTKKEFEMRMKFALYIFEQYCQYSTIYEIIMDFLKDFLAKESLEKCCEIFIKFMKQKPIAIFIENIMSKTVRYYDETFSRIFEILKFSYGNEEFFRVFSLSQNVKKTLFQLTINGDKNIFFTCELFEIYKNLRISEWHKLTGCGQNLSEEEFNQKMLNNNSNIEDFLTQDEVCEDYLKALRKHSLFASYDKNDKEELKNFKLVDQLLSFMIIVDDLKIDDLEKFTEKILGEFSFLILRSRKMIEKFFEVLKKYFKNQHELEKFTYGVNTILHVFALFYENNLSKEYLDNFVLFFNNIENFFISKNLNKNFLTKLMQQMFTLHGSIILIFTIHHKVEFMKDIFRKYFKPNELSSFLVKNYSIERIYVKNIKKIIDEFCREFLELSNYFQLFFTHISDLHEFLYIFMEIKKYCLKQIKYETIALVDETLKDIAFEIFPYNQDIQYRGLVITEVEFYVLFYQLLCFIDESVVPSNYIESFFANNLNQIFEFSLKSDTLIIDKIFKILNKLKESSRFTEIFENAVEKFKFYENDCDIGWMNNFRYFCQKIENENILSVKTFLKKISINIMEKPRGSHPLILAINFNSYTVLDLYQENLKLDEIIEIILLKLDKIFMLKNYEPKNFTTFFENFLCSCNYIKCFDASYDDFMKYFECYAEEYNYLPSKLVIILQFLDFISQIEISQNILEKFLGLQLKCIVFYCGFHCELFIDLLLKIFIKYFSDEKLKVAKWIKKIFENTKFFNELHVNCKIDWQSNFKIFWSKTVNFLSSDQEALKLLCFSEYEKNHPLLVSIFLSSNNLIEFFESQVILEIFISNLKSVKHFFYKFNFINIVENDSNGLKNFFEIFKVKYDEKSDNFVIENKEEEKKISKTLWGKHLFEEQNVEELMYKISTFAENIDNSENNV